MNTNHGLITRYLMRAVNFENVPHYFTMAYIPKRLGIAGILIPRPRIE